MDIATLGREELERLAKAFGIVELDEVPRKLCGGYSSVNFAVVAKQGTVRKLLRVQVGVQEDAVARQSHVLRAVKNNGVPCPEVFASTNGTHVLPCSTIDGKPGFAQLHQWVDGVTANKLLGDDEAGMLRHLGAVLAVLHSSPKLVDCIGLEDVASASYMQSFMHWPAGMSWEDGLNEVMEVAGDSHELISLLNSGLAAARAALSEVKLERGMLHGDPFLDNLMFDTKSQMATMIDWDEAASGPLAYDLACAIVGGCFDETCTLRSDRVRALLGAYNKVRPLSSSERDMLIPLMRCNALITAWYRWRAFHIEVPDAPAEAKESYKEMINISKALDIGGLVLVELETLLSDSSPRGTFGVPST